MFSGLRLHRISTSPPGSRVLSPRPDYSVKSQPRRIVPMKITLPYFRSLVATSALVCSLSAAISARLVAQAAVASSSIDGAVINAATKIRLRGATIDIPALGRQALSDDYGRFLFVDLPAGE